MDGRRRALIVAIDEYDEPALRKLTAPATDARELATVLEDPELGAYEVSVVQNQPSWQVARHVQSLLVAQSAKDTLLLHFSCHGLKDDSGELFLAACDTQPDLLGATALDASRVRKWMQESRAARILVLLDCCYGGAFAHGMSAKAGEGVDVKGHFEQGDIGGGRGRVVITASNAMQYSWEAGKLHLKGSPQLSVFTGALVDGIRTGAADHNRDGFVGLGELYNYLHDEVKSAVPNQNPTVFNFGMQGEWHVAQSPIGRLPEPVATWAHDPDAAVRLAAVPVLAELSHGDDKRTAAAAVDELRQLAEDDSQKVSVAARAHLPRRNAPTGPHLARRAATTAGVLAAVAAALIIWTQTRPFYHEGYFAQTERTEDTFGWFIALPAIGAALAAGGLILRRWLPAAVGILAGTAAWATTSVLQRIARSSADLEVNQIAEGVLRTRTLPRLLAAVLLVIAAVVVLRHAAWLRQRVGLLPGALLIVLGSLVCIGAFLPLRDPALKEVDLVVFAHAVVTTALCLPVAVLSWHPQQRQTALLTVGAYLLWFTYLDMWRVLRVPDNDRPWYVVLGNALILAACCAGALISRRRDRVRPTRP